MAVIAWVAALALAGADPCVECHETEHAAWTTTRHAAAFTNPSFQAAWTRFPDPWCTTCHDPARGVDCRSCHGEGEVLHTAGAPTDLGRAAHDLVQVADLGTRACLSCHQFTHPDGGEPVQTTGDEHARWPGEASCADCHLDDHRLRGARDTDFVREHVRGRVEPGPEGLVAVLAVDGVGHRFPTGDPWRRLVLEFGRGDAVTARWTFGRHVAGVGAGFHETADHRLPPPDADGRSELRVPLGDAGPGWWRLRYDLVDPTHAELTEREAGFVLREGRLPSDP